jgi:signal transduction histidine kinase
VAIAIRTRAGLAVTGPLSDRAIDPDVGHGEPDRWEIQRAGDVVVPTPDGHADAAIRAMVAAHEEERRRIARDLHDVVGQALTAVKLNLESLRRDPGGRPKDIDLRRAIAIVDLAMRDTRDIAVNLRPAILDDLGLVAAARWYLARQGRLVGYRTSFVADALPARLDGDAELACFRVLQEALTNVARHAHASRVRVELRRTASEIVLRVEDDGVGFDVVGVRRRRAARPSLGLTGMSERMSTIGGSIELTSTPGCGARIVARLPRSVRALPRTDGVQ